MSLVKNPARKEPLSPVQPMSLESPSFRSGQARAGIDPTKLPFHNKKVADSPRKVRAVASSPKREKAPPALPSIRQILTSLTSLRDNLDQATYKRAEQTIIGIGIIEANLEAILDIATEKERNTYILELTRLLPEPGFSSGRNKEEVRNVLMAKVNLLKNLYQFEKGNNNLLGFFKTAFISDPCFNGRILNLEEYGSRRMMQIPREALEYPTVSDELAPEYLGYLYKMIENNPDLPVTIGNFTNYLQSLPKYHEKYQKVVESACFISLWGKIKEAI